MFKKTKVRSIPELLGKGLSGREVSKVLGEKLNNVSSIETPVSISYDFKFYWLYHLRLKNHKKESPCA